MILDKVRETIREYKLLKKRERILVAFSGGVDSTGLLHVLLELRKDWSFELFLGHFNHRLRQGAEEDERFAGCMARKYSLPLFVDREDVRAHARSRRLNLEEAARKLRYDFLKKKAVEIGGAKVATGHTMTDQAETFLMRLMRGSGPQGLGGIFPVVEGIVVRPLIRVERKDIESYLNERGIEFRIDESNLDRRFLRNRVRLDLLPYIQKNFEPQIVTSLSRIASIIREENRLLEEITQEKAQKAILKKENQVYLDLKPLSSLPRALARRVVRNFIKELKGDLRAISFEDVESVLNIGEGKEFSLREGLALQRESDQIFLKKEALPRLKYEYTWQGEEPLEIKELKFKFKGKRMKRTDSSRLDLDDQARAFLDFRKLRFPLLVRNRRHGDRYQPLGAPGKKKLKEIMRAKGLSLSEREKTPVFLSGTEIVWILGLPVSEKFKIGEKTSEVFTIEKL